MSEIRAFLAIDLDDDLKPKINRIIKEFKGIDTKIKYVELANLHLTLKFFGDIDTNGLDLLVDAISNVVSEFEPFKINIKGCGAFPNNNHIKVIWVGIEDDTILKDLHDKLDNEFNRLGFDRDKKFSTHLTIGRMKSAKNKNQVKSTIEDFEDFEIGEMEVSRISLKKSKLTPAGPIYSDVEIFEL
ncbi:MAG: RNA 2',3'-cyclic phosphodiesterase [Methanobrevibacter sp.]|uniref:RNA 2',3'-cyclic phosphodiesterase n=1 Tax=Methanobrevibacter sp. TaxID=66852 RepID=UPI0025F9F20C|nr:RNA 2',3'-cyclic phosphodiesterase [Methanobrevibacter sp.]MBQ8018361.1 RNA 2',3'-cyclic phosphodiesterase [Methanobrevibacter sp.]